MNKRKAIGLTYCLLLIIAAIIMLLDAVGINFFAGAINHWYLLIIAFIVAVSLANSLILKKHAYIVAAMLFLGIFMSVSLLKIELKFYETWCLIPIFSGFGLIMYNTVVNKGTTLYYIGSGIMIFFIALMCGIVTGVWRYVLPIEIILFAILFIVKIFTGKKSNSASNEVYYVEPSDEEEK